MDKIGVLLVDDHSILRYGLRVYLSSGDDIKITGEASNGRECLSCCKKEEPDVCLLDIKLTNSMNGLEAAKQIKERFPDVKILVFSSFLYHSDLEQALQIGIDGYITKNVEKNSILESIRSIAAGNSVFSDEVLQMMNNSNSSNGSGRNGQSDKNITEREKEILRLVVKGFSSGQIADELFISPRTVEKHRSNVMKKLEVNNTAALVRRAVTGGFVLVDDY